MRSFADLVFLHNSLVTMDTEFCNKLVIKISELFKIRRMTTTPYNARSNGFVENHNKTLKDQLYHFVSLLQRDWDKYLPTVQLMYNTTVSSATTLTPFCMMYGRECDLPTGEFVSKMVQQGIGR
jgi:hypothetical protein